MQELQTESTQNGKVENRFHRNNMKMKLNQLRQSILPLKRKPYQFRRRPSIAFRDSSRNFGFDCGCRRTDAVGIRENFCSSLVSIYMCFFSSIPRSVERVEDISWWPLLSFKHVTIIPLVEWHGKKVITHEFEGKKRHFTKHISVKQIKYLRFSLTVTF